MNEKKLLLQLNTTSSKTPLLLKACKNFWRQHTITNSLLSRAHYGMQLHIEKTQQKYRQLLPGRTLQQDIAIQLVDRRNLAYSSCSNHASKVLEFS